MRANDRQFARGYVGHALTLRNASAQCQGLVIMFVPRLSLSICLLATAALLAPAVVTKAPDTISRARLTWDRSESSEARRIVDARVAPFSAVGRIKGTMVCTAAVVLHPRIALTAAHCVQASAPVVLQFGYQAGTDLGRYKATVWAIGARQQFTSQSLQEASNDWAVLLLERAPIGIYPFLLGELSADALGQLGRQFLVPSYALDVAAAQRLSLDPACTVRKLAWNVLIHDCMTSAGGSGAPLLIKQEEEYAVVGIHTGAILERDEALHIVKFVGHEATGAWTFAEAIRALSARLKNGGSLDVAGALAH